MFTYSLVVKVSECGAELPRIIEAERHVFRHLGSPYRWFAKATSEPTQITVIVTSKESLKERLTSWMRQLPIDPPFEAGSLLFYSER